METPETTPEDLPEGWAYPSLGSILTVNYGKGLRESLRKPGRVLVYGSNGVVGQHNKPLTAGPTIIIGRKGTVGAVHLSEQPCWPIDTTYFVEDFPDLDARYVSHGLRTLKLSERDTSTAIPGLNRDDLYAQKLPLAPFAEQERIVVKIEDLLKHVNASRDHLAKAPKILKAFRQSVLAAACSGRLTKDWRERRLAEDADEDSGLPSCWRWIKVNDLLPPGGIFDGPFGSNLKTADYTPTGVRVIRLENIGHLRFVHEKETYVSHQKYEILAKHTVMAGDIIFGSFIDEEIRTCVLPKLPTKAIAKADCFCLRPRSELTDGRYLALQLVTQESYERLLECIHGHCCPN